PNVTDHTAKLWGNLLEEHTNFVAGYIMARHSGDAEGQRASLLRIEESTKRIVIYWIGIVPGSRPKVDDLWRRHIACTAAYFNVSGPIESADYPRKTGECVANGIRVGQGLDGIRAPPVSTPIQ